MSSPEYHVRPSPVTGRIFAGTYRSDKDGVAMWRNQSDATVEAIDAVLMHHQFRMRKELPDSKVVMYEFPKPEHHYGYSYAIVVLAPGEDASLFEKMRTRVREE